MSSKPPTRNTFLGSDVKSEKRIIGVESLSQEQKNLAENYIEISGTPGIQVGALTGSANWDVRPLMLLEGSLLLLRMTSPQHFIDGTRLSLFAEWVEKYKATGLNSACLEFGERQNRYWVSRKFYTETLAEIWAERRGSEISVQVIFKDLLRQVYQLHDSGLVHGHISNSNLAVESGSVVLFDYLFAAVNSDKSGAGDSAPEIMQGHSPTPKSDIFSLGQLFNSWLSSEDFPALSELTNEMISPNPAERPEISEVLRSLWPEEHRPKRAYRDSRILNRESLKTGKLVNLRDTQRSSGRNTPAVIKEDSKSPAVRPPDDDLRVAKAMPEHEGKRWQKRLPILTLALIAGLGLFLLFRYGYSGNDGLDSSPYELYWSSSQPSLMEQVAVAAASSKREAQLVITESVLSGREHPDVHEKIISVALNEKWERELSRRDREMIFRLALSRFLPDDLKDVQSLSEAHPGVLLGILGNSSYESEWPELSQIALAKFYTLPDPFGLSFAELSNQGTASLEAVEARALTQILSGNVSVRVVNAFLNSNADETLGSRRLRLLISLFRQMPSLQDFFESHLDQFEGFLSIRLAWFEIEGLGDWNSSEIRHVDRLFLSAGVPPGIELKFEQLADLLSFPEKEIREYAQLELLEKFLPRHLHGFLNILAQEQNALSRYQIVTLTFAMGLEPEQAYPFIADWFSSNPDIDTVLKLLARQGREYQEASKGQDSFSLEAARYLKGKEWSADVTILEKLADHNEALVRALAYSKLNANRVEDARVLRRRLELETSEILKEDLVRKLR